MTSFLSNKMAYVEIFCLLFFIIFILHLIKRPQIGVNEPPLVPYRIPIIGHTYDFLNDSKTFLKECKEKYGEPFSLYIFGGVVTFAGVDSMFEVVNNTTAFSFGKNTQTAPIDKIVTPFFRNNQPPRLNQLVREMSSKAKSSNVPRIQKELLFLIEKFFGNCEVQMIAIFTINMALGQECAQFKDLVSIFEELANDDIFDYFINELQPLDFADDKFMDYLSVHVYLLIYASNLTITKHLTSVLFDYGGRPELWKELYEEQLKIHNELNGNLNIDDVNKMIKLDCFIKESFRHSADIVRFIPTESSRPTTSGDFYFE
ncbi:cytochrome P450 [Gigaspora rosea]|uniref:Cytochrome P450 n=1 Tax=Gigaspora rosea TaxID=44941 RepID=A0A397W8N3_9GLOM|nr:cytochrome P450 [Gigaspora rosea]